MVIGSENSGKANILVAVSDDLVKSKNLSAVTIIKEISGEINGGGGGQPFPCNRRRKESCRFIESDYKGG